MLRKLGFAFVAAASLGVAALAPTSASAWGGGHGWHGGGGGFHGGGWHGGGGWHHGWGGPRVVVGGGCMTRRLVPTPWGPRWRVVNRCY
jgi:hypothetical protein